MEISYKDNNNKCVREQLAMLENRRLTHYDTGRTILLKAGISEPLD